MSNANWSATKNLNVLADGVQIDDGLCESVGQTNAIMHIMASLASGASPEFAALTVTGDFTVDTNTLHVDSTNNRVGIGTTNPSVELHASGTGNILAYFTSTDSNAAQLRLQTDGTNRRLVGTTEANVVETQIGLEPTQIVLAGATYSSPWATITATGATFPSDFTVDTNTLHVDSTNNRVGVGTTSPQAALDVNGAAHIDSGVSFDSGANTLLYYKEGTWTPALSFGGGSTGITYGSRTGTYVQNGLWIYFTIQMTLTNKGSSTGTAAITLPTGLSGSKAIVTDNGIAHWAKYSNMSGISSPNGRPVSASSLQLQSKGSAAIGTVSNTNFTNTSSLTLVGHARLA